MGDTGKGKKEILYEILEKEFLEGNATQKELAEKFSISEQTVSEWANYGDWKRKRTEYKGSVKDIDQRSKEILNKKLEILLGKHPDDIATKEIKELMKLRAEIKRMEGESRIGEIMNAVYFYLNFIKHKNFDLLKQLSTYTEEFVNELEEKVKGGIL